LQALAFYVLARDEAIPASSARRLEMVETLAMAVGSRGMVGGQALDLAAVGRNLNLAELENMHIHKTGALIRASVRIAALAAPDTPRELLERLDRYAKCVGLAYQVRDDILDVSVPTEHLGKTAGADAAHRKPTYPSVFGLAASEELAASLRQAALDSLSSLDTRADPLRWLCEFIVDRTR
jgi:farnesyl diphosphate synthase